MAFKSAGFILLSLLHYLPKILTIYRTMPDFTPTISNVSSGWVLYLVPWAPSPGILHPARSTFKATEEKHLPFMPWWGSNPLFTSVAASSQEKESKPKPRSYKAFSGVRSTLNTAVPQANNSVPAFTSASGNACLPRTHWLQSLWLKGILKEQKHSDSGRMYVKGKEALRAGADWKRLA